MMAEAKAICTSLMCFLHFHCRPNGAALWALPACRLPNVDCNLKAERRSALDLAATACGKDKLFDGFLKLAKKCNVCGLDYSFAFAATRTNQVGVPRVATDARQGIWFAE
jgi:hypothetical protein